MARTARKKSRVGTLGRSRADSRVSRALIAVLLVAAALRLWRIDSPIGGFHAFNEAHYTLIAKNFLHASLLLPSPDGQYVFLETPPFYAYVLSALFRVTGVSILAARLLSVASSLALVFSTFLLGRRLFGERAALAAALIVAVSPVAVLTGRNIQTDSMFLFLLVAALYFYLRAESGSTADWMAFGLFFGLALFTKLFAVVLLAALVAWEVVANRKRRVLVEKRFWLALALAAALPLAFYGYHALRDFAYLRRDVTGGAAIATTFPVSIAQWSALAVEAIWAFSPVSTLLFAAGVWAALTRRSRETLFVFLPLAGFAAFYLLAHKHSYYLLTLVPFGALLAGRWVANLTTRSLRIGLLAAAGVTGAFFSLADLTSMKLGFSEFGEFGRIAADLPGGEHSLLVTREIRDSYGSVLDFYDRRARLATLEDLPAEADGRLGLPGGDRLYLLSVVPPQTQSLAAGWLLWRERYGLELFGWTVADARPNPHFFRPGAYVWVRTGGLLDFGFRPLRSYAALALFPIPPGVGLYPAADGLKMRRIGPL